MSTPSPFLLNSDDANQQLQIIRSPSSPPSSSSSSSTSSSSSLSNLSPSIIITLLILSVTIIVTTCICLLFRHLHRLPLRFLRLRHLSTSSVAPSDGHTPPPTPPQQPNPNHSLIDSLPLFSFSSITRRSSTTIDGDCAVCLSKFKPHDQLRLLPLCCHAFHADCIDTWLQSNHTCPLCRSNVHACDSDLAAMLRPSAPDAVGSGSFRLEIGSVSRRQSSVDGGSGEARRSYSIGSFDYVVEGDSELPVVERHRISISENKDDTVIQPAIDASLAADVASGRSWLGEYMDRLSATLSSRTLSFRSSRRFFTGSSRRSEVAGVGEWDLEASRVGEEISELFRWVSGV